MTAPPLADLHLHSDHSDGRLAPRALVDYAAARGVGLLALTDHDTTSGIAEAGAACAAAGLRFATGVEVSCGWRAQAIHVIGLGLDPAHAGLAAHLRSLRELRQQRMHAIGERLEKRARLATGRALAEAVCQATEVPTRMHLARALVAAGAVPDVQHAFEQLLARGRPGHVPMQWPALEITVQQLRESGAQVVLAHPHRYRLSGGALRTLVAEFRDLGGHALEISIAGMSRNDLDRIATLARGAGLAGSCGSDFHDPSVPWNPPGRFAKLPGDIEPVAARL
jgi:hypothetical protein